MQTKYWIAQEELAYSYGTAEEDSQIPEGATVVNNQVQLERQIALAEKQTQNSIQEFFKPVEEPNG